MSKENEISGNGINVDNLRIFMECLHGSDETEFKPRQSQKSPEQIQINKGSNVFGYIDQKL